MSTNKITIELNGEPFAVDYGTSVQELIDQLELRTGRIAVALNRAVVPKAEYSSVSLKQNDKVEIVNFVGGG
jgi:thiamine biosynthesis protein ThiS